MSQISPILEPMTRQACEPCRRKKSKCTAERPTCSFCQRLDVTCSYLPRGSTHASGVRRKGSVFAARKTGKTSTKDRVRQLESQVNTLYDLLRSSSSHRPVETPMEVATSFLDSRLELPSSPPTGFLDARYTLQSPGESPTFTSTTYEPSLESLAHFVNVYRTKLHLQPLPLFRLENLADQLLEGPRFLLWSFLALTLTLSSHNFYKDKQTVARDFYAHSAEDIVMKLASQGVSGPEVIQSLCLIALRHIRTHEPARAWMVIGAASRLYTLRILRREDASPGCGDDSISRAYWSVFLLERLFLPLASEISSADTPDYPDSAPLPPPLPSATHSPDVSDPQSSAATAAETPSRDIGINEHYLRLVSTWGKIKSYLHHLRHGEVEKPWLSDSTHMKLSLELTEFELQLGRPHLMINVAFPKRTAEDVSQHLEYWNPWITGQIIWHAAQAVLNHPFLHLVVLRPQVGVPQSCLFLQQKVDLALYQASWVFRLIQISKGLLEIDNPLIGDAVLATATVTWLYQFSGDPKVAQRARDDLDHGERFLSHMALSWPHISWKLGILRKLQALAAKNRPQTTNQDATISFKPTWFWDLLDPGIRRPTQNDSPNLGPNPETASDSDAQMCLRSHHIEPLQEGQDSDPEEQPFDSAAHSMDSFLMNLDDLEHFRIEELSRDFLQDGFFGQD